MNPAKLLSISSVVALAGLVAGCAANPSTAKPKPAPAAPTVEARPAPAAPPANRTNQKTMMTVEEVEKARLDGDIGSVHPSFNVFPWLQFDPMDSRPQGFSVQSLYLISNRTEKGVFADGVITVRMFRIDRQSDGRELRTALHTWQFNPEQAMPYRSHRRTVFGQGYGLMLQWPKDLNLINKEIMVVVEFTRHDGRTISSKPKFLKVPDKVNG